MAPPEENVDATRALRVVRHGRSGAVEEADEVAVEAPVALVFNGVSHAVMLATPADLEDFGLGFALSEGLIETPGECYGIDVAQEAAGFRVDLTVSQRRFDALKRRRRTMEGRSGCGLCGTESLDAFQVDAQCARPVAGRPEISVAAMLRAVDRLASRQPLNARTGGLHAAAWGLPDGAVAEVVEDVGRHNALDKLIGRLARCGALGGPGFALVSSRASYELVHKCARVGIGTLAALSAATSLAVETARRSGVRLFAFCRDGSAVECAPTTDAGR